MNKDSHTSFGIMGWGGGGITLRLAREETLICVTCHQHYHTGNGQEYRQDNLITI